MRSAPIPAVALVVIGCTSGNKDTGSDLTDLVPAELEPYIWPMAARPELPADPTNRWAADPGVISFGQSLFFDNRLSGSGTFSCATCHAPEHGLSDGLPLSEATGTTARHAPSIWNVGHHRWLNWDGSCDTLWCQATGPIEKRSELNLSRVDLARRILDETDLREPYTALFGSPPDVSDTERFPPSARPSPNAPEHPDHLAWEGMDPADQESVTQVLVHVAKAIAAWERTLLTGETPVDAYIRAVREGDRTTAESALTRQERTGLLLFAGEGQCVFCHGGWLFSNKQFHNAGLPEREGVDFLDTGRYDGITAVRDAEFNGISQWSDAPGGDAADQLATVVQGTEQLGQFRTPGLRNVADHPPYMHGGHFQTLDEVVAFYADPGEYTGPGHREELVVARGWDAVEQAAVVSFLRALSSTAPTPADLRTPASPPSP